MKNNIKFIIFGILVICLISSLLILAFSKKNSNEKTCNNFELSDLVNEISMATSNKLVQSLDSYISEYIPIYFSKETNYVFVHGDNIESDYFIIAQNLNEKDYFDLKNYIETNNELYEDNQIKFGTYGEYTYAIYSKEYASIIEGIIRSYVYCN